MKQTCILYYKERTGPPISFERMWYLKKKAERLYMKFLTFIYRGGDENGSVLGEGWLSKQFLNQEVTFSRLHNKMLTGQLKHGLGFLFCFEHDCVSYYSSIKNQIRKIKIIIKNNHKEILFIALKLIRMDKEQRGGKEEAQKLKGTMQSKIWMNKKTGIPDGSNPLCILTKLKGGNGSSDWFRDWWGRGKSEGNEETLAHTE